MRLRKISWKNVLLMLVAVMLFGMLAGPAQAADVKGLEKVQGVLARSLTGKAALSWTPNKNAEGYVVFEQNSAGEFVQLKSIKGASKTKLTVRNLENNKTYKFKVASYKTINGQKVTGKPSDEVKAQPFNTKKIKNVHPYYYRGKMRATVKVKGVTFKKGQSVKVYPRNSKGQSITLYYHGSTPVQLVHKGKLYAVPSSKVGFSGYITNNKHAYSASTAEQYVNYRGFSSPTNYFIWVSTYAQKVYIFKGSKFNWKLEKSFTCSTGRGSTPTKFGYGYVKGRIAALEWSPYQWIYYCVDMHPGGWFHSWLYYPDGRSYGASVGRLGAPASHGCVRIDKPNVKWMFDHIPDRTVFYVN